MKSSLKTLSIGLVLVVLLFAGCTAKTSKIKDKDTPIVLGGEQQEPVEEQRAKDVSLTAMQEDNDAFTVETNFNIEDPAMLLRVEGREYALGEHTDMKYTFHQVHVPLLGNNNAKLVLSSGEVFPFTITRTLHTADEWRKYGQPVDYKRLIKDADRYAGEQVKGRGKIIQILEDEGSTYGIIQARAVGYGYWDDNIWFTYDGLTEFVTDDIVNFYGTVEGDYSYTSQANYNLTIPEVTMAILEK